MRSLRGSLRVLGATAALSALTVAAGCRDTLLKVTDPDIIDPSNLASPDGAEGQRVGAIARFKLSTALDESSWFYGGLLVDEWKSADTFTQRDETDGRNVTVENSLVTVAYRRIHQARIQAYQAMQGLRTFQPTQKGKIGEMWFLKGFAEMSSANDFCNGQPFANLTGASPEVGVPLSGADAYRLALASFDSALAAVGTPAASDTLALRVIYSAQVGRGRALLNLGRQADAMAAVASVPRTFSFNLTFPGTQGKEDNFIWALATSARRYTVQDSLDTQGGVVINAMPFVSAKDPRVPTSKPTKFGFDGVTPYDAQGVFPSFNSPVPVANYVDAQLITAEAQLAAGNAAGFITTLNGLRTGPTNIGAVTVSGLAALTDPGTATSRLLLLFRERAFWTFGRGQRLGDLRRAIRVYNVPAIQIFPGEAGVNPRKSANFGPDLNLPVPQAETNSGQFSACSDRKA
jgi:hypothetical protein